jgi:hypothetical protein
MGGEAKLGRSALGDSGAANRVIHLMEEARRLRAYALRPRRAELIRTVAPTAREGKA